MVADFRPDDAGRFLYVWDGTYIINENYIGSNFHGNDESYLALLVGSLGWAGCGYCLTATDANNSWEDAEALRADIVANPDDYYLHMAIKSDDNASHCFYIFGSEETKFVIGSKSVYDGPIYENFIRNGNWTEFDIPMSRFATALSTITCAPGVNIFAALSENIAGAQLNLDAVYFYKKTDIDNDTTPNYATLTGAVDNLTSITIPETITYEGTTYSVTGIGNSAFYQCISLTSVTIPNSVTSIGEDAFAWCDALASVTIGNGVTSIGNYAFRSCSSLTSITIPNSVTSIGEDAFLYCDSFSSIVVENGNTTYDSRESCNAIIETVTNTLIVGCQNTIIPNSVTSIGDYAFSGCSSLTSITIPNSVTSIGNNAFSFCESLASVTIGNGVTSIGAAAFSYCSSLTSIAIPNSVTSIGSEAFCGCSSLTSVTIGNSVTSIGEGAFVECYSLSSIVVESGNATYDSRGNCNAIIETATNTLIVGCQNTIIPNSVTSIGDYTFYAYSSLTSITIPNSVTSIGEWAFSYCESLTTVICEASNVPVLGEYVFDGMPLAEATLYVPAESIDDYKAADQWKEFGTILPLDKAPSAVENTRLPITNSTKLLRNGQLLILREGKTYNAMGTEIK